MRKFFYILVMTLVSAVTFTACDKDDDDDMWKPVTSESGKEVTKLVTMKALGINASGANITKVDTTFKVTLYDVYTIATAVHVMYMDFSHESGNKSGEFATVHQRKLKHTDSLTFEFKYDDPAVIEAIKGYNAYVQTAISDYIFLDVPWGWVDEENECMHYCIPFGNTESESDWDQIKFNY